MNDLIKIKFKHVPFNCKFEFEGQEYEKTNFDRGVYHKDSKMIFRTFKKSKIVKTSNKYFEDLPLTN